MRTNLLNRYVVLIVGLLTMSLTPVWGVDEEISNFSFTTQGSSIPTGWNGSGTGNTSTGNYYFIGSNGSLTSPSIDFSKYSKVTITITGRRYSETSERTITAKVAGTTIGTTTTKGTNLTQLELITLSSNLPTSSNSIVFTANGSATTKGVGISKITITGTLKNIDPINVVLSRNGNITNVTNQTPPYVLPGINEEPAACEGWEFKGWVKTNSVNSTTTPDFVTSVSESCTVYAVYGKTEMGGGTTSYIRVTDVAKIEVGTYAIAVDKVNSQKYNFANAEASSGNAGVESTGTTKSDSYTTLPSGAVLYTLAGNNTDGFSIQEKETGKYLVATASKGSLSYAESATEKWRISDALGSKDTYFL